MSLYSRVNKQINVNCTRHPRFSIAINDECVHLVFHTEGERFSEPEKCQWKESKIRKSLGDGETLALTQARSCLEDGMYHVSAHYRR